VRGNRAGNSPANATGQKPGEDISKDFPFYLHLLFGLVGGLIGGPFGALVYFTFIEKFLANQSVHRDDGKRFVVRADEKLSA
jgi:hypothetical protein